MDRQSATKIIKETFETAFDKGQFINFSKNLVNFLDTSKSFTYQGNTVPDAYERSIQSLERIGKYEDAEDNKVDVLIVKLKKEYSLERARTMQRNFVAWYLNGSRGSELKDAALVAFVSPDDRDWRFSLVRMDYNIIESASGKIKVEKELTPARRYSFLVGENESSHTAQIQLLPILENDKTAPLLSDLEKAFGIEVVTREFFTKYRELFHNVEEALQNIVKKDDKVREEFATKSVDTINFSKKLLGQIVFLYFLQKKGWFGVGRDDEWGTGPKNFLRLLFEGKIAPYQNFFNDVLEPLFYEALALERADDFYSRFNCKIPFLNGGLFDPINNYNWVHTDILLPNQLFSNNEKTKEGDVGTGILDVFDRYNFTVKEDEPLEKDVAVDPEMLGKVFENLIAVKDRKSKGTYYTPREIVHYMCQESLINYLDTAINTGEVPMVATSLPQGKLFGKPDPEQGALKAPGYRAIVPREDIEALVRMGELAIEHDARVESVGRETRDYAYRLPESIRWNAKLIDDKLSDIRVCDPAIGSGAFPVGLMTEIVRARNTLTTYLPDKEGRTNYHFKRHAIQNCLYGVDIDPSAVEIAKLRLWLSLVVDEEDIKQIQPLPNLDYKIVCGNSLLGVEKNLFNVNLFNELESLKPVYFNETRAKKKQEYKKQIDQIIRQITNDNETFDFEVYFSEVFHEKGGFDVVIGNPPYVRVQNMSYEDIDTYKNRYHIAWKRIDISILFIELAHKLINADGVNIYIMSNQFLTTEYGEKAREFLLKEAGLSKIIDFGYLPVFEDNLTYVSIFVIRKSHAGPFLYHKISSLDDSMNDIPFIEIDKNDLSNERWSLGNRLVTNLLKKIGSGSRLKEYATSWAGIITGKDKVFLFDKDDDRLQANAIENDVLLPILRAPDCAKYTYVKPKKFVIYPYKLVNNKTVILDEKELKSRLPNTYKYLLKNKELLLRRRDSRREIAENKAWYGLIRFGRLSTFKQEKIVTPGEVRDNKFCLDSSGSGFSCARVFSITTKDPRLNLHFLLAILNSKLIQFYMHHKAPLKQGGYYSYSANVLDEIPLKIPISQERFISIVGQILAITKGEDYLSNPTKQARVKELERQIDQMVYELYGLTPEGIGVVEGKK